MTNKPAEKRPSIGCRCRIQTIERLKEVAASFGAKTATVHSLALEYVMGECHQEFLAYLQKNKVRLNPYNFD